MRVTVLFFASAREKVGQTRADVEIDGDSIYFVDFARHLQTLYPSLRLLDADGNLVTSTNFAVNKKYNREALSVLQNGDEFAIIPPISGG